MFPLGAVNEKAASVLVLSIGWLKWRVISLSNAKGVSLLGSIIKNRGVSVTKIHAANEPTPLSSRAPVKLTKS